MLLQYDWKNVCKKLYMWLYKYRSQDALVIEEKSDETIRLNT